MADFEDKRRAYLCSMDTTVDFLFCFHCRKNILQNDKESGKEKMLVLLLMVI